MANMIHTYIHTDLYSAKIVKQIWSADWMIHAWQPFLPLIQQFLYFGFKCTEQLGL